MVEWILILFMYAGVLADGDNMTSVAVPGFTTESECVAAGKAAADKFSTMKKETKFVCVKQTR